MEYDLHRVDPEKWPLLKRLDERTRKKIKWFCYRHRRIYCILRDNRVVAAGSNTFGLLGLGHDLEVRKFAEIKELRDKNVVKIVCGREFVLVLTRAGRVYAWGRNSEGQLGIASDDGELRPVLVHRLKDIVDIKCGCAHALTLDKHGKVATWGWNESCQLGNDATVNSSRPTIIESLEHVTITKIECGSRHSLAVTAEGDVYGWGYIGGYPRDNESVYIIHRTPFKLLICADDIKDVVANEDQSLFLTESGLLYFIGLQSAMPIRIDCEIRFTRIYILNHHIYKSNDLRTKVFLLVSTTNENYVMGDSLTGELRSPTKIKLSLTDAIIEHSRYVIPPFMLTITDPLTIEEDCIEDLAMELYEETVNSFDKPEKSDFKFLFAQDKVIYVQRYLLSLRSDYLKKQFENQQIVDNQLTISAYSYGVYYRYIKFIYTQSIETNLSMPEVVDLLDLANACCEERLKDKCCERIFNDLNLENCCRVFEFAIFFNIDSFATKVAKFIYDNIKSMPRETFREMEIETGIKLLMYFGKIN